MTSNRRAPLLRQPAPRSAETGPHVRCADCKVRDLGVCSALEQPGLVELAGGAAHADFASGRTLFDEGEPAEALFNITAGAVKVFKLLADGRRQITGFLFPGDLAGLARDGRYACSAEALGDLRVCRFTRRRFDILTARFPALEKRLLSDALDELSEAQEQMLLLGRKTARERLASFLLRLSERQVKRGLPAQPVRLPMTRADIADYIGLTTETVSRTFTRFKTEGLIRLLPDSRVELVDELRLGRMADGTS